MGATSSAVWAPGKQRHRSCHCWVCLAQQSLCCITEGKYQMNISPQQQAMGQQEAPAAPGSKPRLAQGHVLHRAIGHRKASMRDTLMSNGSPYLSKLTPDVQIAHFKAMYLGTLETPVKEAGTRTVLAPILQVAVFDAIPMFGVAQLAPDIYTPALAGLCQEQRPAS